jgi:DNA-binding FadR family transcriptional regulator
LNHYVTRLRETVTATLLQRVVDGDYAAGEWLPGEVKLSGDLGVSRGVVREAIASLERRGIIGVRHGRGQWARAEDEWDLLDPGVLAALVTARRVDLLSEIVDCQAMLEPDAAALAAGRAPDAAVAELGQAHAAVVSAARGRRHGVALDDPLVTAEIEFHGMLAAMTGNRPLQRMLAPIGTALALMRHELAAGDEEKLVRALRRSLRAVEAHDAEAARKSVEARVTAARRWLKSAG